VTRPRAQVDLRVGQAVHLNARAGWLPATITSLAPTAVGVNVHVAGQPPRHRLVDPWVLRPADGARLEPVHRLRYADPVLDYHATVHTVETVWQARGGWWIVGYTDGTQAVLPASAILRLFDDTPTVTVNGIPLL
jgi:hypothetical protein